MTIVGVWMPVFGRHEVMKAALTSLKEMRGRWRAKEIEICLFVGWSNPEDLFAVVEHYGYPSHAMLSPNEPLSEKQNNLLNSMRGRCDYFLQVGSDDVFLDSCDDFYFDAIERGVEYIGCRSVYFVEPKSQRAVSVKQPENGLNRCFGAGRLWSAEAMDKVSELWPNEANNGLDYMSEQEFIKAGVKVETFEEKEPFVVDIKSETNIWSFEKYKNEKPEDYLSILAKMQGEVLQAVNLLHEDSAR